MEKEEIQNNTSADQNEDTVKENEKPEENLAEENKQETNNWKCAINLDLDLFDLWLSK